MNPAARYLQSCWVAGLNGAGKGETPDERIAELREHLAKLRELVNTVESIVADDERGDMPPPVGIGAMLGDTCIEIVVNLAALWKLSSRRTRATRTSGDV